MGEYERRDFMKKRPLILCFLLTSGASLHASKFPILGPRALGLGGAYVAVAEGPGAAYWNPGALGFPSASGFLFPIDADVEATGDLLRRVEDVAEGAESVRKLQDKSETGGEVTLQDIDDLGEAERAILSLRDTGPGLLAGAAAGLQSRRGRWGLSLNQFVEAGAAALVDPKFSLGDLAGGAVVEIQGEPALNDPGLTDARDQLASVIDQFSQSRGVPLAAGETPETAANHLINHQAQAGGATPQRIDETVNRIADAQAERGAESTGPIRQNETNMTLREQALSELSLSYGFPLVWDAWLGSLALGASVKAVRGEVSYARVFPLRGQATRAGDIIKDARENPEESWQPGVDVGLLYRFPFLHRVQVGALGRNINNPTFDAPPARLAAGEGDYREKAQFRTGLAYWPFDRWVLTTDMDMTRNETSVPGYPSRTWSAGTEVKVVPSLALRGGLYRNIDGGLHTAYSLGLGLKISHFTMDLALALNDDRVELESSEGSIPATVEAGLGLGWQF
jgi:hypothetical protein